MNDKGLVPYFQSYWNNQDTRKTNLSSSIQPKFVLVEGIIDAKIVLSLKEGRDLIPIPVSNMFFDITSNKYLIVDNSKIEHRGKKFIVDEIKCNLSYCFGVVDMDYDFEQQEISKLNGRVVDSKNSISSVGKVIGKKRLSIMDKLFLQLTSYKAGISKSKADYEHDRINLHLLISILGMERFINGFNKRKTVERTCPYSYDISSSFLEFDNRKKYLQNLVPNEKITYLNDHDVVDVFSSYLFGKEGGEKNKQFFVKEIFEKLVLRFANSNQQKIFIDGKKLRWN